MVVGVLYEYRNRWKEAQQGSFEGIRYLTNWSANKTIKNSSN